MTTTQGSAIVAGPARSFKLTMAGLLAAMALAALDMNIVSAALPIMASELGGLNHLSWVVTSFMLAQSATLLIYGKLGDMYGRRPLFLCAVGIFMAGSLLCGLAQSMLQLIALRAVQGVGAAGLLTLSSSTLADLVSPRERGRYQSMFTATFAICSIAGPLVGGGLTSLFGWRSVFLVNLPLGAVVFALLAYTLPRKGRRKTHHIDFGGAALIIVMTTCTLLTLSLGGAELAWSSPIVLGLIGLVAALLTVFVLHERRASEPVLDLTLFRDRVFTTCAVTNAMVGFPFMGSVVFLPLYLQLVRGFVPAQAGLIVVPQLLGLLCASITGGLLVSKFGRYKPFIITGIVLIASSLATIGFLVSHEAPLPLLMGALLTLGIGGGLVMPNLVVAVQNAVPTPRLGAATAFLGFSHALASASGVATSGAILAGRVREHVAARVSGAEAVRLAAAGVTDLHHFSAPEQAILIVAYERAIATTFLTGGTIAIATVAMSLLVPQRELRRERPPAPLFEE